MRRTTTHARDRVVSKKRVSPSHHDSGCDRSASNRSPELAAYRWMKSSLFSISGSADTLTPMPSIVRNHRSSLTHWCTICSCTLRPRLSVACGRTGRSPSRNMLQTPSTLRRSVSYVSTRKPYRMGSSPSAPRGRAHHGLPKPCRVAVSGNAERDADGENAPSAPASATTARSSYPSFRLSARPRFGAPVLVRFARAGKCGIVDGAAGSVRSDRVRPPAVRWPRG